MQWQKKDNILVFPFGWQRPAKTEEWAYQRCLVDFPQNHFVQVVCFPWATLVDLLRSQQMAKAKVFLEALQRTPPRITLVRATVCQHIYMKDLLPFFKQLKITDVFWPHAECDETIIEGIKIHPFPLYPVRCEDLTESGLGKIKPLADRKFLYSFIGAYNPDVYLSPVRQWLFELPEREDGYIESRGEWHYEKHVYGEQISGVAMNAEQHKQYKQFGLDYAAVMRDTIFCLCPSGTGPNSIRLWEALGFGCVPVIISDNLRLPGDAALWESASIHIPEVESEIKALPRLLQSLSIQDINTQAIQILWKHYGLDGFIYDLKKLSAKKI